MQKLFRSTLPLSVLLGFSAAAEAQTLLHTVNGANANDRLGFALASLGDLDGDGRADWGAGALEDGNIFAQNAGLVRVSSGASGAPLFTLHGQVSYDLFGSALSSVGDLDNDGRPEFAVGAPGAGPAAQGKVYVYPSTGGAPLFTILGASPGEALGTSVAGAGDVNGDGTPDFVAGGPLAAAGGVERGVVRVYSGANGAVLHTVNGTQNNERVGWSVDGVGDLDGDGKAEFAVGSTSSGVRIHRGSNGTLLRGFTGAANDRLGASVAGLADLNGDGRRELAVGAPQDGSLFTPGPGYVNVYDGATGGLLFALNGLANGDCFGVAVADARDVDGDGRGDILVGADQFAGGGAGYARIFNGNAGALLLSFTGANPSDRFGFSVEGLGDINLDGKLDFALGAPNRSASSTLAGQVQVWSEPNGCAPPQSYCPASLNSTGAAAQMGWSGSTSVAANDLVLTTSACPPLKTAMFVYGANQASLPGGNGVLCIGAPFFRLPAFQTSAAGVASFPLDLNALPPAGPIQPGDVRHFTLWYRDPPAGGANYNFSNALTVTFCQ